MRHAHRYGSDEVAGDSSTTDSERYSYKRQNKQCGRNLRVTTFTVAQARVHSRRFPWGMTMSLRTFVLAGAPVFTALPSPASAQQALALPRNREHGDGRHDSRSASFELQRHPARYRRCGANERRQPPSRSVLFARLGDDVVQLPQERRSGPDVHAARIRERRTRRHLERPRRIDQYRVRTGAPVNFRFHLGATF